MSFPNCAPKAHRMEERMKEFVNSFINYLFVLKCAQNGGNYEYSIDLHTNYNCDLSCGNVSGRLSFCTQE